MFEIFRQMAFIFEFIFAFYFVNINKLFVGDFLEVVLFLSQFHPKKKLSQFRVLLYTISYTYAYLVALAGLKPPI